MRAILPLAALMLATAPARAATLDDIQTVVVIYAENRSFDNLYGTFPGANGVANASEESRVQRDRDGSVLAVLPPAWLGVTAKGFTPTITRTQSERMANAPFRLDNPDGYHIGIEVPTADLWHRFYENQMQIDVGRNDRFAAWSDSGGLSMGTYDGSVQRLWDVAKRYTLADNFFMGTFGGSFMNHIWLACACVAQYPNADKSPAAMQVSVVEPDGVTLSTFQNDPGSALKTPPKFVNSGALTPDFYAVNTMQPPYQPSNAAPAPDGDKAYANPALPTVLPPQTATTIGDLLSQKGIGWAWYSGAWAAALAGAPVRMETHHQPYNFFAAYAPGTPARAEHQRDGGVDGAVFLADVRDGKLPAVTFYKPQASLNQHAGYANVLDGDKHMADVIAALEASPQWPHMLVVLTYDENGGFWDHVAPPKADRWGPGSRVPALIVSPFARKGVVDHTPYETDSILRFITRRFGLSPLPGLQARDEAMKANGNPPFGDLTQALDLAP